MRRAFMWVFFLCVCIGAAGQTIGHAQASDVVIYASDISTVRGNWTKVSSSSGADGLILSSGDNGWSTTDSPQATPSDYFETTFNASAGTAYHVWLRLRAGSNSKWNDSVWVQFSDSTDQNGSAIYRIQTTSGLLVNLEGCSGCGVNGWGWKDNGYWLSQPATLRFSGSGAHTIRVQTREDGVQLDQIVISPSTYVSNAPGQASGDATIVPKSSSASGGSGSSTPYTGSPAAVPGTIQAENFDNGGEGVAYHDASSTNEGGAYRQSGVDLEGCSEGGSSVGWMSPGEWLRYSVNVASSGTYTATFRVASSGTGGTFHLEMNGNNVSGTLAIPNTGGWQNWTSVTSSVSLNAGQQVARIVMDTAGPGGAVGNLNYLRFDGGGAAAPPPPPPPPPPPSGSSPFSGVISLPGTVQVENFDNGGEGVGYHDSTGGNAGGSYRSTDVDLEPASAGGYDVGWTTAGEWLKYTVSIAATGTYTVSFRVASSGQGGSFHLEMNGSTVTSGLSIPNTGGHQSWTTVSQTVSLEGGQQIAKLVLDGGKGNVDSFQVSAGAPPPPPPSGGGGGGSFRMMTWNIQHGFNSSGGYDLTSQAQFIVSQNPDVVALEEVQTWDENQPPRLQSLLQQMTGQSWTVVWAPAVNVAGTEGNVILTRLPVASTSTFQMHATGDYSALLSNRSAALARVQVGGIDVNVVAAHLDYGNTSWRTIQLQQLMGWLGNFGGPRLVGGDFNSWWGEQWISTMETQYGDTWRDVTGSNENGYTHSGVRFDYLFRSYDGASHATPTNVFVPSTSLSDHYPVVADYRVQ